MATPSTGLLAVLCATSGTWFWLEQSKINKKLKEDPGYFRRNESRSQAITVSSLRNGAGITFVITALALILRLLGLY